MHTARPVTPNDFALESLEPRLLLDGTWDSVAAPNGGNWNTAANWVGGVVPTSGQVVIAGLNANAQVTVATGASVTTLDVQAGSLVITGGTFTVSSTTSISSSSLVVSGGEARFVGGITTNATGLISVTGGLLQVWGTTTNAGQIAVGGTGVVNSYADTTNSNTTAAGLTVTDNGVFNVYYRIYQTGNSTIELSGNGTLNIGDESAGSANYPELWVNNSLSPPNGGIHASGSSRITLGGSGTLRLEASNLIKIDGAAGLTQNGGTLTFVPPANIFTSPATTIDALSSTKAVALDLQSGLVTGTGTFISKNANFGVTFAPSGMTPSLSTGVSSFFFEISDNAVFLNGARLESEVFKVAAGGINYAESLYFDNANAGLHRVDLSGLEIHLTAGSGFDFDHSISFPWRNNTMEVVSFYGSTLIGSPARLSTFTESIPTNGGYLFPQGGYNGIPWGMRPSIDTNRVYYDVTEVQLHLTYTFTGAVNNDWGNAGNWTVTAQLPLTSDQLANLGGIPWYYANVVIPAGKAPVITSGIHIINSIVSDSPVVMNGGYLLLVGHPTQIAQGGMTVLPQVSAFNAAFTLNGGTFDNHADITFGSTVTMAAGTRFYNEDLGFAETRFNGATTLGGLFYYSAGTIAIGTGGSLTSTSAITVPYQTKLYAGGNITTPTLTVVGELIIGAESGAQTQVTLTGNLVMDFLSGKLTMSISGPAAADVSRLTITGTAALAGTLQLFYAGGYSPGPSDNPATYVGLSAAGGISGYFITQTLANYLSLQSGSNQLIFVFTPNSAASLGIGQGIDWMEDFVRAAATYFNLNTIAGSPQFPVAPQGLATLFDLSTALSGYTLAQPGPAGTDAELGRALINAGYGIDTFTTTGNVGLFDNSATPFLNFQKAPDGLKLVAHLSATAVLSNLTATGGFNAATTGLLQGLAADTSALTGAISWTASLTVSLVFGVDLNGNFVISSDSAITLALASTGVNTISGTLNVNGTSTTVSGTASASFAISLHLGAPGQFLTPAYLDAVGLTGALHPTATGTAQVDLGYSLGNLTLAYGSDYTVTADVANRTSTVAQAATLTGSMTFPGLQTTGGAAATVNYTGAYSLGTWTLSSTVSNLKFLDFSVAGGTFSVVLSPTAATGSGTLQIDLSFLASYSNDPARVTLGVSFNATTVTYSGAGTQLNLLVRSEGATPNTILAAAGNVAVGGTITGTFSNGAISGNLSFSGGSASFAPDAKYTAELSDTNSDGIAFVLDYNVISKVFTIAADKITFTIPNLLSFSVEAVTLTYDRSNGNTVQTLATIGNSTEVEILALKNGNSTGPPNPTITVSTIKLTQNGFELSANSKLLNNIKISDFLSFDSLTVALGASAFKQGQAATGTLGFGASGGRLYPGQSALDITLGSITASFSMADKAWSLQAASLTGAVGNAFSFSKSNVQIDYNLNTAGTADIATVAGVAVQATEIGLLSPTTTNLVFRNTGVTFNFSMTAATATIGDYFQFTGAALTASNLKFDYGANTFSGSLGFTFGSFKLYPSAPIFSISVAGGVDARYNITGTSPSGVLSISLADFTFKIGGAIDIEATNVLITPMQNVIMTIASATVSIEKLSNMEGTLTNFIVTQSGFSVGNLDIRAPDGQTSTLPGNLAVFESLRVQINNFGYDKVTGLSGTIVATADSLRLLPNKPQVNIIATQITGGYQVNASGVSELTFTVGTFTATMNPSFVVFSATNLVITPESSTVVTIGSVTATVDIGGTVLSGTGGNFAIHSDGSLAALPNFGVTFGNGTSTTLLRLPSWLPLTITQLGLSWPDFNNAPGDFNIVLSANVTSLNGLPGLAVSGAVSNLVISISELRAGRMPIIDLGGVAITISGNLFGGTAAGSLALGIMKFDAAGNVIPTTDSTTPVAKRVMYGALRASFRFSGLQGFSISIGVSEYGPLNVYVGATGNILLDAASGLTLTSVSADVQFNTALPDFQDPTELRNSVFNPVSSITDAQWLAQLQTAVANQAQAPPGGSFWSAFSQTMLIRGSASFRSAYSPDTVFRAEVNVLISTDGRMAIGGTYVFANTLQLSVRMYADFTGPSVRFLFLSEQSQPTNVTIMGTLTVSYIRFDGTPVTATNPADGIKFALNGSVAFTKAGVGPKIIGSVELTFAGGTMFLKLSGSVRLPYIGDVVGLAGDLQFFYNAPNMGDPQLIGALYVQTNFNVLESLGIKLSGTAFFVINTYTQNRSFSLTVPGQANPVSVFAPAGTFSIYTAGIATFTRGGVEWFSLEGGQYYEISSDRLIVSQNATMRIGPYGAPLLTASTVGYIQIDSRGVAGQLSFNLAPNTSSIPGTVLNLGLTLQVNTTGQAVAFSQPNGLNVSIAAAPAGVSGAVAGPYALLSGSGTIGLLGSVLISASQLRLLIGINLIQMDVVGTIDFRVNGTTLFNYSVSGGFQIDAYGIAAALSVSQTINGLGTWGITTSYTGAYDFRLNTTGQTRVIAGIALRASVYAEFSATLGISVAGLDIGGTITFSVSATDVTIGVTNGTVAIKVNGSTMLSFTFSGVLGLFTTGSYGIAFSVSATLSTNVQSLYGFTLTATFRLDVNTTALDRTINGILITANTVHILLTNAVMTVSGVTLSGNFEMLRQSTNFSISFTNLTATFKQAGTTMFTFTFSGGFTLAPEGIAAVLATGVTLSSGPPSSADVTMSGLFSLEINTTNLAKTIAGRSLEAGRYVRIRGQGSLVKVYGVDFTGDFTLTANVSSGYLEVTMTGNTYVWVGSTVYFRFNMSGAFRIGVDGVAAQFALSMTQNIPSYIVGISVAGNFSMDVNTTGAAVAFANGATLESGTYVRVRMAGSVTLAGVSFANAALMIELNQGAASVAVTLSASSSLAFGGTTYFAFTTSGNLVLDREGIAGGLAVQLSSLYVVPGLTYNLEFFLAINTTSTNRGAQLVTPQGIRNISLAAQSVGIYALGSIRAGDYTLTGNFTFRVGTDRLEVMMNASTNVFGVSGSVSGAAGIYSDGMALSLQMSIVGGISRSFMTLTGTFILQLNTTGRRVLDIAPSSFLVGVTGATLTLTVPVVGQVSIRGSLIIGVSNGVFRIAIPDTSPISFNVFGFGNVNLSGFIDSNGNFSFTGSLSNLELGRRSIAGLAWTYVTVNITNNSFAANFTAYLFLLNQNVGFVSGSITSGSFNVTAGFNFTVPGVKLSINGTATVTVTSSGISGSINLKGNFFDTISVSGSLTVDSATNYYKISVGFSISIGSNNLGASLDGNVTVSSNVSENAISGSARAWAGFYVWNPFGSDWWIGGTVSLSFRGGLDGKFSLTFSVAGRDWSIGVDLSSFLKAVGSDISGGYAFLDLNGDGIWQPGEARVAVDSDGNFTFAVGDTSIWMKDATNTFAFQDLNGNGVWDEATEARLALVNGELPAVLVPATIVPGDYAPADPTLALGLLQAYGVINSDGVAVLNPALGRVMVRGGSVLNINTGLVTANTTAVQLSLGTTGYTGLVGGGQVVFFDTNNNGVLDNGEVSVAADSRGFYTFTPDRAQLASLGILAGFDTNHNGKIDASEGTIVLAGGTDKSNGLPVQTVIRMSAENVGNGLALVAQPLSALHGAIVLRGYDASVVNTRMSLVFGLPVGIDFATVDMQTGAGLTDAQRIQVQKITSQLESYLLNASSLLATAGATAAAGQQAALSALVDRVLQNYSPTTQGTIATADMVDLSDLATLTALLTAAAAKVGVSPAAATRDAVAQVTRELNLRAAAYAASSSSLTRDLARIDALAQGAIATDIGELAAGRITATIFLSRYTGAALDVLLAGVALTPVTPPSLTGVTNVTTVAGSAASALNLHLATTTGVATSITLTAVSSNPVYLANTALTILGSGADRVLVINPTGLGAGSVTITLTAALDGQVITQTLVFTVTAPAALAPEILTPPVTGAVVDQLYNYGFVALPAVPGRTLVITASGLPTWLVFTDNGDGTASLIGTPSVADLAGNAAASYAIVLTATDNTGAASAQAFTLQLVGSGISFPTFGTALPSTLIAAGALFTYNITAAPGAGASSVAITASTLPAWLRLTDHGDGTATLSGTPTLADLGSVQVILTATDNLGLTNAQHLEIAVFPAIPPVIAPVAGGTIAAGQVFTRTVTVTPQAPATRVAITASGLPAWLTFTDHGDGTGTLSGTPALAQAGAFTLVLTATDDLGATSTRSVSFTVIASLALAPIGNVTMTEGGTATVTISLGGTAGTSTLVVATAANNTLLPATGLVLSGSGATRTLTVRPAAGQSGSTTVTVTATEGGLSLSQSFTVNVTGVDHPVVSTGTLPEFVVRAGSPDLAVDLSAYFRSADGAVTFAASGSDPTLAGVSVTGNILAISPNAARSGVNVITVVASSRGGTTGQLYTATGTVRLTVVPELSIAPAEVVRTAGGNVMRFVVTLLTPSNQTVRVGYATQNGTALAGVDYVAASGTLEFAPGVTQRTIDVTLAGGLLLDPVNFNLGLSGASNAIIGTGSASGQIPADRGVLVSVRINVSSFEFTTATSTENEDVLATLVPLNEVPVAPVVRLGTGGEVSVSGGATGFAGGNSLVEATSLGALGGLHEIRGY